MIEISSELKIGLSCIFLKFNELASKETTLESGSKFVILIASLPSKLPISKIKSG